MTSAPRVGPTVGGTAAGAAALFAALFLGGCGRDAAAPGPQCVMDDECGDGRCVTGTCLPTASGRLFALEITPRSDSSSALTELTNVILGPESLLLTAEDGIAVNGTLDDPEGTVFSGAAQLVAQVPSQIVGRASLQLDAAVSDGHFRLGMARSLLDTTAMIRLLPPAAAPQQPPFALSAPLRDGMSILVPTRDQMTALRGRLLDSLGMAAPGYTARAKAGMTIVSSTATTDEGGAFELLMAPGAVPASANGLVTIELSKEATTDTESVPTFVTNPFAPPSGSTGTATTYNLPAFTSPVTLYFAVQTSDANPRPIAGATLRFSTSIDAGSTGTAVFVGEGRSDASGDAHISLIPGTSQEPRMYDVSIIPPPNSGLSAECMARLPVLAPTSNSTQYAATFMLQPRVKLSGVVSGADGRPGRDVTVTATSQGDSASCPDLVATVPASTTTDASGHYELSVDRGSYRLDVDPPYGSALPRVTLDGDQLVVVEGDMGLDIPLPNAEVATGTLVSATGAAVPMAGIKVFQSSCASGTCTAPVLRAQARTDGAGAFQVVLPLAP